MNAPEHVRPCVHRTVKYRANTSEPSVALVNGIDDGRDQYGPKRLELPCLDLGKDVGGL